MAASSSPSAPSPALRASDADRERVAAALRRHHVDGRLDTDELQERLGACYAARTLGELEPLLADLPGAGRPAARARGPPPPPRRGGGGAGGGRAGGPPPAVGVDVAGPRRPRRRRAARAHDARRARPRPPRPAPVPRRVPAPPLRVVGPPPPDRV